MKNKSRVKADRKNLVTNNKLYKYFRKSFLAWKYQ
jgi:hypothetical protein